MTDDSALAERKHPRHAPAFEAQVGMPDGIDTAMKAMQSASANADLDRVAMKPGGAQLGEAHHAVLPSRDSRKHFIGIGDFFPHTGNKSPPIKPHPFIAGFPRPSAI